jgi:uncharacterized protein
VGPGFGLAVLNIVTTIIFAVVFLGEEIGWRGYLLFRLAELTSGRRAALLTGAFQAIFNLPLLLIATTYQSEGNRWIVVPMVMVTLTLAGAWYGWLRLWSGSIWPVTLSHSAFNNLMEGFAGVAIATSRQRWPRDYRDRGSDHDHHGAGRGLLVDSPRRRLRQGPA